MTIKVASIISRMNVGGPAVMLAGLSEALDSDQFEFSLITGTCNENEEDYLNSHKIQTNIFYVKEMNKRVNVFNDIACFIRLMLVLRKIDPQIIHTHTSKAGFLGRIAARIATPNARLVHTYHGHLLYGYFGSFKSKLIVEVEKLLARITDKLVAVAEQVRDDLLSRGIGKTTQWVVLHPGIPIVNRAKFCPEPFEGDKNSRKFTIVWIGRFTQIKNPKLAIEAFEIFSRESGLKYPNIRLIMIGSGEDFHTCVELSKRMGLKIDFLGHKSEVYSTLAFADLLLLTSVNEGLPLVILEAAMVEVPALSTRVGGVNSFIVDGVTGYFSDSTAEDIAASLLARLNSKHALKQVGRAANHLVNESFSLVKYANSSASFYKSLLTSIE